MPDDTITTVTAPAAPEPASTNLTDTATAPVTPHPPQGVSDAEWNALGDPGKAALVRERQAAAQAAADLAALRKEIEDSKKTAEQRVADDLRAAQAEAAANATKALRYEAAVEAGIPLSLATRLVGSTLAELVADAEALKTQIPVGATPPRTPAPDPSQGPRPVDPATADDAEFAAYAAAMKLPSSIRK